MTVSDMHGATGAESPDLEGLRVLVVEDSWQVGTAVCNLLRSFGADVLGLAATTAEAERLLAEQVPDVVLMDVNLRGGEMAYDLIDRLHERRIRVIVTTGYDEIPLPPEKAIAVLGKPMNVSQLLSILRSLALEKNAR
jgi:CheY-like chemotaxis protein